MLMQAPIQKKYSWRTILRVLFAVPGVVLIEGDGKIGKTDLALKISEDVRSITCRSSSQNNPMPLILDVASNINTEGYYPQISDLISLRQWMYSNNHRKLYIMDEANEYLSNLRVMSAQNVGFDRLLPQTTKAHTRIIIVGHDFRGIDKNILRHAWCKGLIKKTSLKTADIISQLLPQIIRINNIPQTTIAFEPYAFAPFAERPEKGVYFKDTDLQMLYDWADGKTAKELGKHNMQINRLVRDYVRRTLENEYHLSHS